MELSQALPIAGFIVVAAALMYAVLLAQDRRGKPSALALLSAAVFMIGNAVAQDKQFGPLGVIAAVGAVVLAVVDAFLYWGGVRLPSRSRSADEPETQRWRDRD